MATDFKLQDWLAGLDLSDEERRTLEPVLAKEPVQKKLREQVLMRSDYSKHMDALTKEKQELEAQLQAKLKEADEYAQGLASWKGTADKTLEERNQELAKLQSELQATKEAMSKISTEYGIDPSQYVQPSQPAVPVKAFDESILGNFVKTDDFQKAVSETMQFPNIAAELMDIANEHYELYGKRLPSTRKLVEEAIQAKKSIRDTWAQEFKVEERRAELAKKAHDEELDRVRQETEARVRSELKIPAQRPNAARPIMLSENLKGREIHRGPAGDREAVDAAMAAFSSGKYAEGAGQ